MQKTLYVVYESITCVYRITQTGITSIKTHGREKQQNQNIMILEKERRGTY